MTTVIYEMKEKQSIRVQDVSVYRLVYTVKCSTNLAVYSIRDVVEHLSDHLEVHLDDRVDRVEALDRVDRADHHGIAE